MARNSTSVSDRRSRNGKNGKKSKAKQPSEATRKQKPPPTNTDITITFKDDDLTVQEKCNLIAELSESILEDPSTAFSSNKEKDTDEKTCSKMQQLLVLAKQQDDYVSRLAIMSLLALFQDILPSYRIRLPTAAEMAVRVTKETKKLWDYERSLLFHYQQYLKLLQHTWNKRNNNNNNTTSTSIPSTLEITAMLSLCELCKSAFHFNFASNILQVVVRQMNNKQCDDIADAACRAISYVFQHDAQGTVALEATRLVAKMMNAGVRVRPQVLQTFVALPLRVHVEEAQAAKLAAAANAKRRKRNPQEADIQDELNEGSSSVDKIVLAKNQSDTLQAVTLTYFAILKREDSDSDYMATLLPTALEGLAKFAHLLNFDTVLDLLGVFKTLLKRVDQLTLEACLNCILTAFQTLQGPGRELKIDQKEYITPLYSQLPR